MSFHILLTEGIVGGFVAATARRVVEITGDQNGGFVVHSTLQGRSDYKVQRGEVTSQEITTLVSELRTELVTLPTDPTDVEDIYGLDTSIHLQTDDGFEWRNGGPSGCVTGESRIKPTPEQKALFQKLVGKIWGIGERFAIK